ncbi:small glutamine-rich tetratricopeptide repeat-containing protein 2 [Trichomonascus vanleenenianus]|uniref:Sgt2p n=1 Tax=Trichomonascus vanleenenianus TaxID=2268995 RepID=UPI003ECA7BC8
MVNQQKKDLAVKIVDFLQSCKNDNTFSGDDAETADVAIECITGLFDVEASVQPNDDLLTMFEKFSSLKATEEKPASASSSEPVTPTVTEEQKEEANKLKIEGNRYIAQREFQAAADAYSKAIAIDPTNAVYFSNRSAAYSSLRDCDRAAEDARKAIELDPAYSRAYSRLGLALYSLGDTRGAVEAYEKGLKIEGDSPSDGMKRGYEAAKKRLEEELDESSNTNADESSSVANSASASDNASGARGMPDFSSMFGGAGGSGGAGGLPDLSSLLGGGGMPDLGSIMQNPQFASMAQNLMSNPNIQNMMSSPGVQNMMRNMQSGQMPSFSDIMNNPELQNIARSAMGGNNDNGSNNNNESGSN